MFFNWLTDVVGGGLIIWMSPEESSDFPLSRQLLKSGLATPNSTTSLRP
jgi:hypothetical protein